MSDLIPFSDIAAMAQVMAKTRMFGKSADEMLSLMLLAQAEGKHPAIAAQEYDVIQGKPAINSRSALARFQVSGGAIRWIKRTDQEVSAEFSHPQGGKLTVTWTMERAVKAGLTGKDNWKKYPAQMLSARVIAEGVRAVFPACLSSLYTVEEVQDFPEIKTVNSEPIPESMPEPEKAIQPDPPKPKQKKDPIRDGLIKQIAEAVKAAKLSDKQKEFYRQEIKSCKTEDLPALLEEIKVSAGTGVDMTEALEHGFIGAEVRNAVKPEVKPEPKPAVQEEIF